MWEVVVLKSLSTLGTLRHEVELSSGRRPDFELQSIVGNSATLIVGDVATVSDAGLDDRNPVGTLRNEITRLARKHRLEANHFQYRIEGGRTGVAGRSSRVQLSLPQKQELREIIRVDVEPFIRDISQQSKNVASYVHNVGDVKFTIQYDNARRYMMGGHPSYTVALSLSNNPLANALAAKIKQLRRAPQSAIRVVVLCDGGCDIMTSDAHTPETFDRREIVRDVLRQSSVLDLVVLVSVKETGFGRTYKLALRVEFVWTKRTRDDSSEKTLPSRLAAAFGWHARRMSKVEQAESREATFLAVERALDRAFKSVPTPQQTPSNASIRGMLFQIGPDNIGAYKGGGNSVKISSRALVRLLAGEISSTDFFVQQWGGNSVSPHSNPFQHMFSEGRMIKSVNVENGGDEDDDWLEFEFGDPDAAAAPFVVK